MDDRQENPAAVKDRKPVYFNSIHSKGETVSLSRLEPIRRWKITVFLSCTQHSLSQSLGFNYRWYKHIYLRNKQIFNLYGVLGWFLTATKKKINQTQNPWLLVPLTGRWELAYPCCIRVKAQHPHTSCKLIARNTPSVWVFSSLLKSTSAMLWGCPVVTFQLLVHIQELNQKPPASQPRTTTKITTAIMLAAPNPCIHTSMKEHNLSCQDHPLF